MKKKHEISLTNAKTAKIKHFDNLGTNGERYIFPTFLVVYNNQIFFLILNLTVPCQKLFTTYSGANQWCTIAMNH